MLKGMQSQNEWFKGLSPENKLNLYRMFFCGYLAVEDGDDDEVIANYKATLSEFCRLGNFEPGEIANFEIHLRVLHAQISASVISGTVAECLVRNHTSQFN